MLAAKTVMLMSYWTAEVLSFNWVCESEMPTFLGTAENVPQVCNFWAKRFVLVPNNFCCIELEMTLPGTQGKDYVGQSNPFSRGLSFDFICEPCSRGLDCTRCYLRLSLLTLSLVNLFDFNLDLELSLIWRMDHWSKLVQCNNYQGQINESW